MKSKEKSEIVLRALNLGIEVKLDGSLFSIIDGAMCIWQNEEWYEYPVTIDTFLKWCNDLSDEDLAFIACNITLNTLKIKR